MSEREPTLFEKVRSESEQVRHSVPQGIRYSMGVKVAIILGTILACAAFFSVGPTTGTSFAIGSEWAGPTQIAQYPFPVEKPADQYQKELDQAKANTPLYFLLDTLLQGRIQRHLEAMLSPILETPLITMDNADSLEFLTKLSRSTLLELGALSMTQRNQMRANLSDALHQLQHDLATRGFANIPKNTIPHKAIIVVLAQNQEQELPVARLFDENSFQLHKTDVFQRDLSQLEQRIVEPLTKKYFVPNLLFSEEWTERASKAAIAAVPKTLGIVRQNEIIITNGERISEQSQLKLQAYQYTRILHSEDVSPLGIFIGNVGHTALVYSLLLIYLFFIRQRIFLDNWQMFGLSILLVLSAFLGWASMNIEADLPLEYLIILPAFAMLAAILFDSRSAFYTTVTMAFLLAGVRGNDYESTLAIFLGSTYAAYTVRDLRSRTQSL